MYVYICTYTYLNVKRPVRNMFAISLVFHVFIFSCIFMYFLAFLLYVILLLFSLNRETQHYFNIETTVRNTSASALQL